MKLIKKKGGTKKVHKFEGFPSVGQIKELAEKWEGFRGKIESITSTNFDFVNGYGFLLH